MRPSLAAAVNLVYLEEPLVIPPRGYMTAVTKRETGPDVRFFWLSATTVNEGANDPSKLFVNNDPNAASFMGCRPESSLLSWLGRLSSRRLADAAIR